MQAKMFPTVIKRGKVLLNASLRWLRAAVSCSWPTCLGQEPASLWWCVWSRLNFAVTQFNAFLPSTFSHGCCSIDRIPGHAQLHTRRLSAPISQPSQSPLVCFFLCFAALKLTALVFTRPATARACNQSDVRRRSFEDCCSMQAETDLLKFALFPALLVLCALASLSLLLLPTGRSISRLSCARVGIQHHQTRCLMES